MPEISLATLCDPRRADVYCWDCGCYKHCSCPAGRDAWERAAEQRPCRAVSHARALDGDPAALSIAAIASGDYASAAQHIRRARDARHPETRAVVWLDNYAALLDDLARRTHCTCGRRIDTQETLAGYALCEHCARTRPLPAATARLVPRHPPPPPR